jgi:hypothetical protein
MTMFTQTQFYTHLDRLIKDADFRKEMSPHLDDTQKDALGLAAVAARKAVEPVTEPCSTEQDNAGRQILTDVTNAELARVAENKRIVAANEAASAARRAKGKTA